MLSNPTSTSAPRSAAATFPWNAAAWLAATLVWTLLFGGLPGVYAAERPNRNPPAGKTAEQPAQESPATSAADRQWREGAELTDVPGTFNIHNGRVVFQPADGRKQLVALENLNLERVARVLGDQTDPLQWVVSGVITEYRGVNFLLMRRVVLKNRSVETASKGS